MEVAEDRVQWWTLGIVKMETGNFPPNDGIEKSMNASYNNFHWTV
jgi:hypothetical protein